MVWREGILFMNRRNDRRDVDLHKGVSTPVDAKYAAPLRDMAKKPPSCLRDAGLQRAIYLRSGTRKITFFATADEFATVVLEDTQAEIP
ncbi:hypothetical protein [Brucella vulpis]|uniref:hypothetical protein n=1 Tax=Brucella vulpis TaxID=981386 RepID=UPI0007553E60